MGAYKNTEVYRRIHRFTLQYKGLQGNTWVIQGFEGVYMGAHINTEVYRSIHGCTHEYGGLQEYTLV